MLKEDDDLGPSNPGQGNEGEEEERNENVFKDLSNPVSEGGDNFSTGEKQLIWSVLITLTHATRCIMMRVLTLLVVWLELS